MVVLTQQRGSKLYVANTGRPYPLRMDDKRPGGGLINRTEFDTDFRITAPSNALSNAITAEESAWLAAVTDLRKSVAVATVRKVRKVWCVLWHSASAMSRSGRDAVGGDVSGD